MSGANRLIGVNGAPEIGTLPLRLFFAKFKILRRAEPFVAGDSELLARDG